MRSWVLALMLLAIGVVLPRLTLADGGLLGGARAPLVAATHVPRALLPRDPGVGPTGPSLFAGPTGILTPMPTRLRMPLLPRRGSTGPVARLLDIIARAEAGQAGYDAVQHGARVKPPKPPTQMTLGEIAIWTRATPGQPHAIGRYQFIPATLNRLTRIVGARPTDRFDAALQDRLAERLLVEAGLAQFRSGSLSRTAFMNNLAKIWAGLPNSSGRSHYHGYAGNKATMTWARFEREVARAFDDV